jgi:hypothetical protein
MTSQTLSSPHDTDPRLIHEGATVRLTPPGPRPSPLPRADLADTLVVPLPKREGFFLPDTTHPDTMPVPPRPPQKFQPDTTGSPQPYPAPVPAGPKPRNLKVLVPLEREEPKGYVGQHRDPQGREGGSGYVGRHVRPSMLSRVFGGAR